MNPIAPRVRVLLGKYEGEVYEVDKIDYTTEQVFIDPIQECLSFSKVEFLERYPDFEKLVRSAGEARESEQIKPLKKLEYKSLTDYESGWFTPVKLINELIDRVNELEKR